MVKIKNDLTGKQFGRLTVIQRSDDVVRKNGRCIAAWVCKCSCGNPSDIIICGHNLTRKNRGTLSCGCLAKEKSAIRIYNASKKYNDYEVQEDYVIMYTTKGEPFFVDLEDFWRVKDYCWYKNKQGYIASQQNRKGILLHDLIMNCPKGYVVDHIGNNDTLNDCRKSNLRIGTRSQNGFNRRAYKNNKTGVVGVRYSEKRKKYEAYITVNKKRIYLGRFDVFEDAVDARKKAEHKYSGEWSYDESQKLWRENNE